MAEAHARLPAGFLP